MVDVWDQSESVGVDGLSLSHVHVLDGMWIPSFYRDDHSILKSFYEQHLIEEAIKLRKSESELTLMEAASEADVTNPYAEAVDSFSNPYVEAIEAEF